MMQQTKNRWLIVLAAIGIHISIGSVYAWSVLTKPIMQAMGFSLKEVTWTFSLAILFLGTSAGFLGTYVEKYGPRRSGLISMCFFRKRSAGYGLCTDAAQPAAVISFLRRYRRYRSGNRLYYPGVYTGEVVPQ